MPTLALFSDTHTLHKGVQLPNADIAVCAGDISGNGKVPQIIDFLTWYEAWPHEYKVLIAGNHDRLAEGAPGLFASLLAEHAPSVIYLNESATKIMGLKFFGSPWSPAFYDWAFNAERGDDIKRHWDQIPDDTEVLITHGPPQGVLDWNYDRESVGCESLRYTIDTRLHNLRLHTFGHVHGPGGSTERIDGKIFVNSCVVNENYELTNQPILLEL